MKERNKETLSKKEIILNKTLLDLPPPFVTSRCWAVVNGSNGELLFGKLEKEIREIASLTKIMVCITVLKLCKKYSLNLKTSTIKVTEDTTQINGTTANLKENDILSIWDLLHGLMLPSGNDASFLLADYFGRLLKKTGKTRVTKKIKWDSEDSPSEALTDAWDTSQSKEIDGESMIIDESEKSKYLHRFSLYKYTYIKYFLMEMNYYSKEEFKLSWTFFDSPHGMTNRFNTSTAHDLAKLSAYAMKNAQFSKIVKTRRFKWYSQIPPNYELDWPEEEFSPRLYTWENTNKLLWRNGYIGLKTGITQTAGPCLAANFKWDITDENYIIVLLNSRSMDHRWNEVGKLKAWTSARMRKIKKSSLFMDNPSFEKRILTKLRHL